MSGDLRIGDAERERASSELGEHLAAGRIDLVEHTERLDAAWSARTQRDLDVLFFDLPAMRAPAPGQARAVRRPDRRFGGVPLVWIAIAIIVATVLLRAPVLLLVGVGAAAYLHLRRGRSAGRERPGRT